MSRVFKSMTYRLVHSRSVWIILIALVAAEVLIFFFGGSDEKYTDFFANHHTYIHHDHESGTETSEYVNFEEEDPLLVNKLAQKIYMGRFEFVPGQTSKYEVSINNAGTVSELLSVVLSFIIVADLIFIMAFFGELFSDGAVRNMVTVKTPKVFIYMVSVILNAVMCIIMYVLVFASLALCTLLAGFYPIIYVPAFVTAVLVGLLITVTVTTLCILILFVDQNPLVSFIFCIAIFSLTVLSLPVADTVFERPYYNDDVKTENFFKGGYKIMGEGEWYFPVDDFRVGRVYYPADDETVEFFSDTPNPYYPSETMRTVTQFFYRANLLNYTWEMNMFFIYPMYRDGLLTRYAAFSAGYLLIIFAGGCYIVGKRNIN